MRVSAVSHRPALQDNLSPTHQRRTHQQPSQIALRIERPKVRNRRSVENLNTLTYVTVNLKALRKAKTTNASLLNI